MTVSVCMITFNHEKFIVQALESILAQQRDFDLEIVIGDDGSKDQTQKILAEYRDKYPAIIKPILRPSNIGAANNFIDTVGKCNGDFIALLEGDDFWSDTGKLQKQVNRMKANHQVALCAHNTSYLLPDGTTYLYNRDPKYNKSAETEYLVTDYIIKDFFHTSSILMRRSALPNFPDWYRSVFGGDYFLVLLTTINGSILYLNEVMSVYRINNKSISHYSTRIEILDNYLKHLSLYDEATGHKYSRFIADKKFSLRFGRKYYYPNYFNKLGFALSNIRNIARLHPSVISRLGRWKIFVPTFFLRSKVNLFKKNTDRN